MHKRSLLLLISILVSSAIPLLFLHEAGVSGSPTDSKHYRGENYTLSYWPNGSVTYESTDFWIWDGWKYVPYIYEDRYLTDGYLQIRTWGLGCRIHDYYSMFYDPNMSRIRVYDERWEVQKWKTTGKEGWDDIGAQSGDPTWSIVEETDPYRLIINKAFHSWAGWLNISYAFREDLKHEVTFTSELSGKEEFRLVQKWAGIVGAKCKDQHSEVQITSSTEFNGSVFEFLEADGSTSIWEDQNSAQQYLQPVTVELHAQGMKADFVFGSWSLTSGETLKIDPTTYYISSNLDDAYEEGDGTFSYSSAYLYVYANTNPNSGSYRCSGFMFQNIAVPQGASITSATLYIYVRNDPDDANCKIYGHDTNDAPDFYDNQHIISTSQRPRTSAYTSWVGTNRPSGYNSINVKNIVQEIVDRPGWVSGYEMAFLAISNTNNNYQLEALAKESGTQYRAKVSISYNLNPTNDACDSSSNFYHSQYGWVNMTVSDADGVSNLATVDIQVNTTEDAETFTLRWTQSSNIFSEQGDPSGICTLDVSESVRINVDGDTDKICFKFMFTGGSGGYCEVEANTTDDSSASDVDTYSNEFFYEPNTAPIIGEFSSSAATIYADEWFSLNATINDADNNITAGTVDFLNATVEINGTIILKWDNGTNTFSIQSDPNAYCTLNATASSRTTVNSTAYNLSWRINLAHNYTEGNVGIIATDTKVYDSCGASGSNSQPNLFYFDVKYALNLRAVESEGNALTEAIVYMNNGTQHNMVVNDQGWANWTDITSSTVDVYATWYDYTVNSTFTITMDEDKTIDIVCKAYPFVLDGTRYWMAGNATVSSYSWNQATKEFVITFGGGTDTYTLKSSATTQPTYILNCAFDMDTDWTTYLTLTHDASRTITIAYPNWVSTTIRRADHIITATYWASEEERLYVTLFGTSGQTGALEVHCGSRGPPESTTGLSDTVYFSSTRILAGTYSFRSTTTVELDWSTESSGSTGGTTTTPGIFATAENIDIGTIQHGASKNFNATATWSGSTTITLADVAFSGEGSNWLEAGVDFPVTVHRLAIETSGTINVPITIAIPNEAKIGDYKVLVEYRITVGGQMYETRANIMWTVASTPIPPGGVPTIVSVVLFVSLAGAVALSIKKK
jgi:hypothetical protein